MPEGSPGAPFNFGSLIVKNGIVYTSDFTGDFFAPAEDPGRISRYSLSNGLYLGDLDVSAFSAQAGGSPFQPRGMVFGPDGLLYVTSGSNTDRNSVRKLLEAAGLSGWKDESNLKHIHLRGWYTKSECDQISCISATNL